MNPAVYATNRVRAAMKSVQATQISLAQVSQMCANWLILCTSRLRTSHLLSLQTAPSSFGTLQNVTECDRFAYLTHFQRLFSLDERSKSRSAEGKSNIDRPSNSAVTARQTFFRLLHGPGRVLSAAKGAMSRWPVLAAFGRPRNVGHRLPGWKWPVLAARAGSPLTDWYRFRLTTQRDNA